MQQLPAIGVSRNMWFITLLNVKPFSVQNAEYTA